LGVRGLDNKNTSYYLHLGWSRDRGSAVYPLPSMRLPYSRGDVLAVPRGGGGSKRRSRVLKLAWENGGRWNYYPVKAGGALTVRSNATAVGAAPFCGG
jgi:hypothetical protein